MSMHHDAAHPPAGRNDDRDRNGGGPSSGFLRSRGGLVAIGFLLVAAFLLFSEHRAHVLGFLPFLLLLACPLMHLFMHRGHGGNGHGGASGAASQSEGGPR
ncbi:DUF2933 domain-containing protein [Ancylobacter polymorphus]|uniref:DUF2933 domain-containing protein n=1 Tax=Ancylobacter polymorphus TaxID=223390 RepID=A0ABU0BH15_9HYPH|nr:DUF2933 domain-containing protein [Ancylobacter polymorphus]MDQ0304894.1 hypothetical protein [Ancylobacter polymorphus]